MNRIKTILKYNSSIAHKAESRKIDYDFQTRNQKSHSHRLMCVSCYMNYYVSLSMYDHDRKNTLYRKVNFPFFFFVFAEIIFKIIQRLSIYA